MAATSPGARDQGPTGVSRRRSRISDTQTEKRMLTTALELIADQGLTVSLDHLSMETVIAKADVSRASAYRRWPYKDLFLADLLVAVAQDTDLSAEPAGLVAELSDLIARADLTDPQARRDLLIEALRRSSTAEVERLSTSPRWRTYLALSATLSGLPEGRIRDAASRAIADAEDRFATRRERVYRNLALMIGYRTRGPVDADTAYRLMAVTSGATMTGYIVKSPADQTQTLKAFGSSVAAEWSAAAYGLTAVFDAFLEPDPDADWSTGAIAARRRLWEQTAAAMYEMPEALPQ